MKRIALIASGLLLVAALAGALRPEGASAEAVAPDKDSITVSGVGVVRAVPNVASISAGVETRAATAKAAMSANAAAMQKVIAALRNAGGKDVTTQTVSLSPSLDEQGKPNGFIAANIAMASTSLDKAGAIIDAAVTAGATTIYGPMLSRSDADKLYRDALAKAVDDARLRADVLAKSAGRTVGRVTSIVEGGATAFPVFEKAAGGAVSDSSAPVVGGEQETSAAVSVTFELK